MYFVGARIVDPRSTDKEARMDFTKFFNPLHKVGERVFEEGGGGTDEETGLSSDANISHESHQSDTTSPRGKTSMEVICLTKHQC